MVSICLVVVRSNRLHRWNYIKPLHLSDQERHRVREVLSSRSCARSSLMKHPSPQRQHRQPLLPLLRRCNLSTVPLPPLPPSRTPTHAHHYLSLTLSTLLLFIRPTIDCSSPCCCCRRSSSPRCHRPLVCFLRLLRASRGFHFTLVS